MVGTVSKAYPTNSPLFPKLSPKPGTRDFTEVSTNTAFVHRLMGNINAQGDLKEKKGNKASDSSDCLTTQSK